jgi:hypothetical protein
MDVPDAAIVDERGHGLHAAFEGFAAEFANHEDVAARAVDDV